MPLARASTGGDFYLSTCAGSPQERIGMFRVLGSELDFELLTHTYTFFKL